MYTQNSLKKISLPVIISIGFLISFVKGVNATVPRPDHVVICMLENHDYAQVVGTPHAPYINSLIPHSAHLMEYYGLTHPSQPNYIMLFSGGNQGETTDNLPSGTPWTTKNLGASLINTGYTFGAYSEGLPTVGSTVGTSGAYARKHCPWVNWQGTGTNQIPSSCNMSMNDFPSNFNHLPDVSFVIPNQNNDMHNGSDPGKIQTGDAWVQSHLKGYIDWCQANNSLFILTFDEDNFTTINHIPCLIIGPMVVNGDYYLNGYNHYDMLRTLEDMFNLPYAGASATATTIEEIWASNTLVVNPISSVINSTVFPNPINDLSQITINNSNGDNSEVHLMIYNPAGRLESDEVLMLMNGKNTYPLRRESLSSGIYCYILKNEKFVFGSGKIVVN